MSKPTGGLSRRDLGVLAAGAMMTAQLRAQTTDPALDIADWSYYWYGVEKTLMARGTAVNGRQIYVEHWIPRVVRHPYPVVLVHGGNRQAIDWLTTPDNRRGWAQILLEQGYKVYIVDRPGQGRVPYHPWLHGNYAAQTQTFEAAAAEVKSAQWPGTGTPDSPEVAQFVAASCQAMPRNAVTQETWTSRGVMLLEDIGPAIFLTHGDGAAFAIGTATSKPALVKAIVTLEDNSTAPQGIAILAVKAPQGNGRYPHLEKNNRDILRPITDWLGANVEGTAPPSSTPTGNSDDTSVQLSSQGHFWVGIQRKTTSYGTIPMGQMFVQYMKPARRTRPFPIVMVHGGGGQGCHMMGIGRRPGWVHFFVQNGYDVYWVDRPSYGRATYHPEALPPSHLPIVPAFEGLINATNVFKTEQWPGPGGMDDPLIGQFMANERGNISDEALHSNLVWPGGVELLDKIGPSIVFGHAFGGFFGWGVADRRPDLVKAIVCMEINSNPFAGQFRWGLTAAPMTYDPPVTDPAQFRLIDVPAPADSPRPIVNPYKLQAEPARKWKNLAGKKVAWITSEDGAGGSPVAQVAFLKQVGLDATMLRLRDYGIRGNGNLMLMEKNNHEVYRVVQEWLDRNT